MYINFKDGVVFHFVKNVNDGKNSIIILKDGRLYGKLENVSANWGNYWFKWAKDAQKNGNTGEWVSVMMHFDFCAFRDNYDFYSDIYKDEYSFRPHLTNEEWKEKVKRARERKP